MGKFRVNRNYNKSNIKNFKKLVLNILLIIWQQKKKNKNY